MNSLSVDWDPEIDRQNDSTILILPHYCYSEPRKIGTLVLGHSLVRSLIRPHRSLICLLRTARFAHALHCAHSFVRSLARSLAPELMGKSFLFMNWMRRFHAVLTHSAAVPQQMFFSLTNYLRNFQFWFCRSKIVTNLRDYGRVLLRYE